MSLSTDQRNQPLARLASLEFRVDEIQCARQLLGSCASSPNQISKAVYDRLSGIRESVLHNVPDGLDLFIGRTQFNDFQKEDQQKAVVTAINFVRNHPDFQSWAQEAKASMAPMQSEWNANVALYSEVFCDITKLDLSRSTYKVNLVHPGLPSGLYLGDQYIQWRYVGSAYPEYMLEDFFPHYNGVYLCHEMLHDKKLLGSGTFEHAVIQLATDNEMRKRFTGQDYPPFIGHAGDIPNMELFYDDWVRYLKGEIPGNILDFARYINAKHAQEPVIDSFSVESLTPRTPSM